MRYVGILVMTAMFGCQQPPPRLQLQPPPIAPQNPDTTAKIVSQISQPPSFNPGNINLDLQAHPETMQTLPLDQGMKQFKLMTNADDVYLFDVAASGEDVSASDIIINLQPVLQDQLLFGGTKDGLNMKIKRYTFTQPYVEGVVIPPVVVTALARKKSYCEEVFTHNTTNGNVDKLAVGGLKPDIPSSARHCSSFNEIYNFDQKMRIHLYVNNVPNKKKLDREQQHHERRARVYCMAINRAKNKVVGKLQDISWGGEANSWTDILGDILVGTIADVIQYKLEDRGYECNQEQYGYKSPATGGAKP